MSFTRILLVVLSGLLLAVPAVRGQVQSKAYRAMLKTLLQHSVPEIQVQEAARDTAGVLFLDAREPQEYAVSHLRGAVAVGYDHFDLKNLEGIPKDRRDSAAWPRRRRPRKRRALPWRRQGGWRLRRGG